MQELKSMMWYRNLNHEHFCVSRSWALINTSISQILSGCFACQYLCMGDDLEKERKKRTFSTHEKPKLDDDFSS